MSREKEFKAKVISKGKNPSEYDRILCAYFEAGEGRKLSDV